jgi:hypothetical protein
MEPRCAVPYSPVERLRLGYFSASVVSRIAQAELSGPALVRHERPVTELMNAR